MWNRTLYSFLTTLKHVITASGPERLKGTGIVVRWTYAELCRLVCGLLLVCSCCSCSYQGEDWSHNEGALLQPLSVLPMMLFETLIIFCISCPVTPFPFKSTSQAIGILYIAWLLGYTLLGFMEDSMQANLHRLLSSNPSLCTAKCLCKQTRMCYHEFRLSQDQHHGWR